MSTVITDIEIRACRGKDDLGALDAASAVALPGGARPDFTVVTLTTSDGVKELHLDLGRKTLKLPRQQCHKSNHFLSDVAHTMPQRI